MYILSIILSCTRLHGGKLWFARVSRQLTMVVLKICILNPDFFRVWKSTSIYDEIYASSSEPLTGPTGHVRR